MNEFEVRAWSPASPAEVWAVLVDSRRWPDWTSLPSPTLECEGDPAPDGLGAIRRFSWGPVGAREEVVLWEPPQRYGYAVIGGMPIRGYTATVTLADHDGGTAIAWRGSFDRATVPGLSRPLRWFTATTLQHFADRLADHAAALALRAERRTLR